MVFSHGEEPLNAPDKQFITQLTDWQKRLFDYLVTILVNLHDTRRNLTFGASTSLQIDRQTGIETGCIRFRIQGNIGTDLDNFMFTFSLTL